MEYLSCDLLEHGISFQIDSINPCCCVRHEGGGKLKLISNYNGEKIDWDYFFKQKQIYRNSFKSGNIPKNCVGCLCLKEQDWNDENYINYMHINHWTKCNSSCIYCPTNVKKDYYNSYKNYNVYTLIKDLIDKNLVKENTLLEYAGGECTILEEFEELMQISLDKKYFSRINSSGIKYSKSIEQGLKKGQVTLVVSVDAGSKKTFKKIKQVNSYNQVWKNLANYVKAENTSLNNSYGSVKVKYIIMPGLNDSLEEIELWLKKCKEIKCNNIILDIEAIWHSRSRNDVHKYIYYLFYYIEEMVKKYKLHLEYADGAEVLLTERPKTKPDKPKNIILLYLLLHIHYYNYYFKQSLYRISRLNRKKSLE